MHLKKVSVPLINPHYNNPKTSLLAFEFEPDFELLLDKKKRDASVQHSLVEGKDVYFIDGFFSEEEAERGRDYFSRATFSKNSYGSPEAIEKGEEPARSMDSKERWLFFSTPPQPVLILYQFFKMCAHCLHVQICTFPWELCDSNAVGSSSVVVNFLEKMSQESMELGKHRDCDPSAAMHFGIPNLYESTLHPPHFENGEEGKPWLISVMLYVTDETFLPEHQLGTVFYNTQGECVLKSECRHMRLVVFEGDILHSIETSKIPESTKTWRVSCVFKLVLNPKKPNQSIKKDFRNWVC